MNSLTLLAIAVVVVVFWIYSIYASVIRKRNKAQEAFSSIDVQLKKRYDLIPNILTIAQKYMEHERGIMEEVTKLRTQVMGLSSNFENIEEAKEYIIDAINGIKQHTDEINNLIKKNLKADWTLERISKVDLIRLGYQTLRKEFEESK